MIDDIVSGLKAAGEPTRLRLLRLLSEQDLTVSEMTQILGQSQPRVSRHLKLLTEAGLVERLPEGAWAFYRLADFGANGVPGLSQTIVSLTDADDPVILRDLQRLDGIKQARSDHAAEYFSANAEEWGRIRALHVPEEDVEAHILDVTKKGTYTDLVDLGTGTGRMLELLSGRIERGTGIDTSHEMLTVARANLEHAGVQNCHVRHGDIFAPPFKEASADLITIHQVLHFLNDPADAVTEAGRLLRPKGHLVVVDFAPHELEFLRKDYAHRRLGFSDRDIKAWMKAAGLTPLDTRHLSSPETSGEQLTVALWLGERQT